MATIIMTTTPTVNSTTFVTGSVSGDGDVVGTGDEEGGMSVTVGATVEGCILGAVVDELYSQCARNLPGIAGTTEDPAGH